MLSKEDNELLTRVGPGTPMCELLRRFWMPGLLEEEIPTPDCDPVRLRLLGEDLVAFRDTNGRIGVLDAWEPLQAGFHREFAGQARHAVNGDDYFGRGA